MTMHPESHNVSPTERRTQIREANTARHGKHGYLDWSIPDEIRELLIYALVNKNGEVSREEQLLLEDTAWFAAADAVLIAWEHAQTPDDLPRGFTMESWHRATYILNKMDDEWEQTGHWPCRCSDCAHLRPVSAGGTRSDTKE